MKRLFTLFTVACFIQTNAQIITTFAGNGQDCCSTGDGGQATAATFSGPKAIAIDGVGNIFVSDIGRMAIRKINTAGIVSNFAGNESGYPGFSGNGGQATAAALSDPEAIAFDALGNVYIADASNGMIRMVNSAGIISTVAGGGTTGLGDGGQATAAELGAPGGVAVDASGNLYISDTDNMRIRKVDNTGIITTVAGNGVGAGTATGSYSGDGGQATAAGLNNPNALCFDAQGSLYICDYQNFRVRKVTTAGIMSTVVGIGTSGSSGNGGPATSARINGPYGVAFDVKGNMFIADESYDNIRKVTTAGIISTFAGNSIGAPGGGTYSGDGGLATAAGFYNPYGVAFDVKGNLYTADSKNNVLRKVTPPLLGLAAAGSATLCAGATATLTASGANSYTWSPITGLSTTTGSMVVASPTVTTTYTVIGAKGDSMSLATVIVTINIPIIAVNSPAICIGATATLTASGATTYTWSTGATGTSIVQTPTVTTIYTVTATNALNCSNSNTATITVSSYPVVAVNSPTTCAGTAGTLTASGANTYSWSTGATTATISPSPTVTTTYTVTGKNTGGCLASTTAIISVNPKPTVTVNSATICAGNPTTLAAYGANTYSWSSNAGSATTLSVSVSPTVTTTYSVTGTATNTCKSVAISTVSIVHTPTLSLAGNTYTICNGASQTFSVSGAASYTWSPAVSVSNPTIANPIASPTTTTIYTVSGTSGCANAVAKTVSVTVTMPSTATINPVGCNSVMVNAITYTASGTFTQSLINAAGCDSTLMLNVTINSSPTVSYTLTQAAPQTWDAYPSYSSSATGASWNWGDATPLSNGFYPSHMYAVAGKYTVCVTVTDALGCTAVYCQNDSIYRLANTTSSTMVSINVVQGQTTGVIRSSILDEQISVYPNPNNGNFTIETQLITSQLVEMFDLTGRLVLSQAITGKANINVSDLANGIYNIKISSYNNMVNKRILITK